MNQTEKIRMMTATALMTALVCILAPLSVMVGPVSLTLQNFVLGLAAVTLTTNGALRILLLLIALVIAVSVWAYIARTVKLHPHAHNSNVTGEKHEKEQH